MKLCILAISVAYVASTNAMAVSLTETNRGIYLAFAGWRPPQPGFVASERIRSDDKIVWSAFSTNGAINLSYAEPSYGLRVRMLSAEGKEVKPSALGRSYGSNWLLLRSYKDTRLGSTCAQGVYDGRNGGFTGPMIASPKDLFEMKSPGVYTMELEAQIFIHSGSTDPKTWQTNLLHFGPLKIGVENPGQGAQAGPRSKS
jgi:hypothetical protein